MTEQFTEQEIEDAAWAAKKHEAIRRDLSILERQACCLEDDPIEIPDEDILARVLLEDRERYIRGLKIQAALPRS
jgi:hypothetical protein